MSSTATPAQPDQCEEKPPIVVPDEALALARHVAATLQRQHSDYVERDDIFQEACEWACLHPERVQAYLAMEPDRARALIFASMRNHAYRFVIEERLRIDGPVDRLPGSQSRVEQELLPAIFLPEAWKTPPPSWPEAEAEGDWTIVLAECAEAYCRLDAPARDLVERRFRDGKPLAEIAADLRISEERAARDLRRAVLRIREELDVGCPPSSVDRQVVGSRRAMTNSAAVAMTRMQE